MSIDMSWIVWTRLKRCVRLYTTCGDHVSRCAKRKHELDPSATLAELGALGLSSVRDTEDIARRTAFHHER